MDSRKYWAERNRRDKLKVIKRGEKGINDLKKLLLVNYKDVQKQIEEFYKKYADNSAEQLSLFDTKKYKKALQNSVKKYPKDRTLKKILREDAPKYKIDRLREFETQLQTKLAYITAQQEQGIATTLKDIAKYSDALLVERYKKGLGLAFNLMSERKLEQIINQTWVGKDNWSERIWKDRDLVGKKLTEILSTGVPQGESLQVMTSQLKNAVNSSYNDAFRLVRTETAHIDSQVTLRGMQESLAEGIATKYKYDAFLDDRTSTICKDLDGEIIDIVDAEVGKNYPPMHPNCRSTTYELID